MWDDVATTVAVARQLEDEAAGLRRVAGLVLAAVHGLRWGSEAATGMGRQSLEVAGRLRGAARGCEAAADAVRDHARALREGSTDGTGPGPRGEPPPGPPAHAPHRVLDRPASWPPSTLTHAPHIVLEVLARPEPAPPPGAQEVDR